MLILVACEESQRVTLAFRLRGHKAFSCDITNTSGSHPEWHIKQDVIPLLNGNCSFKTCDGKEHFIFGRWDMVIAFPPCTDLCISGARHFEKKRADGRQEKSILFFTKFLECNCEKICIENPVGIISGNYITEHFPEIAKEHKLPIKPTQIIQPYEYGHPYTKKTCLWLKGLPELQPTKILTEPETGWVNKCITPDGRYGGFAKNFNDSKTRSKTFVGVATAMAVQWG